MLAIPGTGTLQWPCSSHARAGTLHRRANETTALRVADCAWEGTDILRTDKDILSGIFFIALGAFGLWVGWDYAFGTAARMGPGFVPKFLCWLLIVTGTGIAAAGLIRRGPGMERWDLRPLTLVLAGVLVFGALIERSGLVAATVGLVLVGAAASAETRWVETLLLSAALAGASILIFVRGLGLPMKIMAGF